LVIARARRLLEGLELELLLTLLERLLEAWRASQRAA
jgi:hypothetical protein